jgi:hypothetical protein
MVLVASSRSARTALPSEQNQPGRRLEQAAQPAGACRGTGFCRLEATASFSMCSIIAPLPTPIKSNRFHRSLLDGLRPQGPHFKGKNTLGLRNEALAQSQFARKGPGMDVMGLTPKRPCAKHIPSPRGRLPEWRPAQGLTLGRDRTKGEFLREFR